MCEAGILIHGVGMSNSHNACSSGLFLCIWLYAVSKMFIYTFLTEKACRPQWNTLCRLLKMFPSGTPGSSCMGCCGPAPVAFAGVPRLSGSDVAGTPISQSQILDKQLTSAVIKFAAMPVLMTVGRVVFFKPDMTCVIGLESFAYGPSLVTMNNINNLRLDQSRC
jgi:hypothetical protein